MLWGRLISTKNVKSLSFIIIKKIILNNPNVLENQGKEKPSWM
jgi:hypothetical protein